MHTLRIVHLITFCPSHAWEASHHISYAGVASRCSAFEEASPYGGGEKRHDGVANQLFGEGENLRDDGEESPLYV